MIERLRGSDYREYGVLNQAGLAGSRQETIEERGLEDYFLEMQLSASQLESCTYTHENEKQAVKSPDEAGKWDINEEAVYELYASGTDLEALELEELICLSETKSRKKEAEENKEKQSKMIEEKIKVIKKQEDKMYLYAASSNEPITINSLYENNFKGDFKKGNSQYSQEEVESVLAMNGLAASKGNMWAGNLLMMYDMGVSSNQIEKLQSIQLAVSALEKQYNCIGEEDELIKNGQVQYQPEYISRITDELGMVTDEHIEKLTQENSEISIDSLRESIHKNASRVLQEEGSSSDSSEGENTYEVEEIKKQIHQIRTKLTAESAQKISKQMPLESMQLTQVAQALQEIDVQTASEALEKMLLPASKEHISKVSEVVNTAREMEQHFSQTVQIQISTGEKASLQEIQSALKSYRENETPVESRFGESIKSVENQIGDLLAAQGTEVSQINIEAAKALIASGLEVNSKNLQEIQGIVIKLNTFLEEVTPLQAAAWIKEGINPMVCSVEELLNEISDSKISGLKNSVAETIADMEKHGEINEEQKKGMIGLYRILREISSQKEEILGYLHTNQLPVNLENLQLAARSVHQHIDRVIDDSVGEMKEAIPAANSAKELIQNSLAASDETMQVIKMLEEISLPITDEKTSKINALLYPYIKEQFKASMGRFDGISTLPNSFLEKIQTVQNASPDMLSYMSSHEIPFTLSNIYWMEQVSRNPSIYGELLDELGFLKEELPENLEKLEEELTALEEIAKQYKEECASSGEVSRYKSYKQVEEIVKFQQKRIENEGLYQIPLIIEGERKLMNLYVQNNKTSSNSSMAHLKAVITYPTKHLGTIKAFIEIQGENIGFKIEAQKAKDAGALEQESDALLEKLSSIGYKVKHSKFEKDSAADGEQETHLQEISSFDTSLFEQMI